MTTADDSGKYLANIFAGCEVEIFLKDDRSGKFPVRGVVTEILTQSSFHPHGIMVKLGDGKIGRVNRILSDNIGKATIPQQEIKQVSLLSNYTALNNIEKIQQFLIEQKSPYCDDCLSKILSIFPRQQIKSDISRKLESKGIIGREYGICNSCSKNKIVNLSRESIPSSEKTNIPTLTDQKNKNEIDFGTLVKNGENEFVEFKSSALWSKNYTEIQMRAATSREVRAFGREASKAIIAKTISGFLNTKGGHLVLGIQEKKTQDPDDIIGIESEFKKIGDQCTDGYRRMIVDSIIRKYFHPDIYNHFGNFIKISFPEIEGKILCWIQISKSDVPAFVTIQKIEYFFIRLDAETRELDGQQMVEYCAKRFSNK